MVKKIWNSLLESSQALIEVREGENFHISFEIEGGILIAQFILKQQPQFRLFSQSYKEYFDYIKKRKWILDNIDIKTLKEIKRKSKKNI